MENIRSIQKIFAGKPTLEGAGVKLKRAFGYHEVPLFDPFLLLDDFHSDNPSDYLAGFPMHPHRGIETITYLIHGKVEHQDSLGNKGIIGPGQIQWMTAGNGIIHQEMPKKTNGSLLWGTQLWANLPSSHKMMNPRYRDITENDIPEVKINDNIFVKIISGEVKGVKGPVQDIVTQPEYLDITISGEAEFLHEVEPGHTVFAYILLGSGIFEENGQEIRKEHVVLYKDGYQIRIRNASKDILRFLLVSGKPIYEPVAWRGPIVMNSQEELQFAFEELRKGTFIKHK